MSKKKMRVVDRISGRGRVMKDGAPISTVLYSLQVHQQSIEFSTFGGKSEVEGHRDIRGEIRVLDGELNFTGGGILTLEMEDGNSWKFFAKRGSPITRRYQVTNASGDGIVPAQAR